MARKRPMEDQVPASSSDEDDDVEEEVEEDPEESSAEENNSAAEDDDEPKGDAKEDKEEDEEEEEEKEEKTPLKKQKTDSGEDDSDSESDSESEKSLPSPNVSDFKIKPIVTKLQKSAPKSIPKPKPIATESSSKRKKPPSSASNGGAGVKTPGGARLWSEADEIAILKGMIEYKTKKGSDPYSDSSGFHDFIKQSFQADVSKNQLMEKIRRLKKKYQNNAAKGQNGNDPVFAKPHEHKSFELSKKIWGNETNGKINKSQKKMKTLGSEDQEKSEVNGKEDKAGSFTLVRCDGVKEKVSIWNDYPCFKESFERNMGAFRMTLPEQMVEVIGREKLKEMEGKFEDLRFEELKLFIKRNELVQEQARAVLDVVKGSNV